MATFGFIGEGITDQLIIEDILLGFSNTHDLDEPEILPLQPPFDYAPGGWTLVFHYLRRGEYRNALQTLDYLVIHVDTDRSEDVGFDVAKNNEAGVLAPEALIEKVVEKLIELIGKENYEAHASRFIFAIAVDSTECWLMPLVFQDSKAEKTTGCLDALNYELKIVRGESRLSLADHSGKDAKAYRKISRDYRKPKVFRMCVPKNPSLTLFVRQLERLLPPPEAA